MNNKKYLTTDEQIAKVYREIEHELSDKAIKKAKSKRTLQILYNVAFTLAIFVLLVTLITVQTAKEKGQTPMVLGFSLQYVQTGSMHPAIPQGSIILAKKPKTKHNLKVGDIITFSIPTGEKVTHRIVEIISINGEVAYQTKGDNNDSIDQNPVLQEQIITIFLRRLS